MKFLIVLSALVAVSLAAPTNLIAPWTYPTYSTHPGYLSPITYGLPIANQYHAQDVLGQYNYGYITPHFSKAELKTIDGTTTGGYTYLDSNGIVQSVKYTSDPAHGFRVAATNLPVAPEMPKITPMPEPVPVRETPEVLAAREEHMAAMKEAELKEKMPVMPLMPVMPVMPEIQKSIIPYSFIPSYSPYLTIPGIIPSPVSVPIAPSETPEVAAARAQHLAAFEQVKSRTM